MYKESSCKESSFRLEVFCCLEVLKNDFSGSLEALSKIFSFNYCCLND